MGKMKILRMFFACFAFATGVTCFQHAAEQEGPDVLIKRITLDVLVFQYS
jgi:hypothetical protein